MAWGDDGSLWLAGSSETDRGLARLDPSGVVTRPFGEKRGDLALMQILPGSRTALVIQVPQGAFSGPVLLLDLVTGETTKLVDLPVTEVRYTVGHLVYLQPTGTLEAVPFDLRTLRTDGSPVLIASGVSVSGNGVGQVAVAGNGTIAYVPEEPRSLVLVDRTGASRLAVTEGRNFHSPRFSRDGRRILTDFTTADGRDVWALDLQGGVLTRATFSREGHDANWMPDGRSLVYTSVVNGVLGLFRTRLGSAEPAESLLASTQLGYSGIPVGNGETLVTVATSLQPGSRSDIGLLRQGGRGPLEPVVATRFEEQYPAVSPDNRWLAFVSNQSGPNQVYVRPLDGHGDQVQVSLDGGTEPVWGPDGRELFYLAGAGGSASLIAATLQAGPALSVTRRKPLFPVSDIATAIPHSNYDISPDGRTFAMVRFNPASRIMVIQNLPALVERLRGGGNR